MEIVSCCINHESPGQERSNPTKHSHLGQERAYSGCSRDLHSKSFDIFISISKRNTRILECTSLHFNSLQVVWLKFVWHSEANNFTGVCIYQAVIYTAFMLRQVLAKRTFVEWHDNLFICCKHLFNAVFAYANNKSIIANVATSTDAAF